VPERAGLDPLINRAPMYDSQGRPWREHPKPVEALDSPWAKAVLEGAGGPPSRPEWRSRGTDDPVLKQISEITRGTAQKRERELFEALNRQMDMPIGQALTDADADGNVLVQVGGEIQVASGGTSTPDFFNTLWERSQDPRDEDGLPVDDTDDPQYTATMTLPWEISMANRLRQGVVKDVDV
jgi:hypothetical protein